MELNFKKFGEGCPLIILHGLYGSGTNWLTIGRSLSNNFTVYLVDQRNHGDSPHSPDFSYHTMVEDLEQFMDKQKLDRVCMMGHSMGGKVVMQYALTHPQRVKKIVVIDIALRSYLPETNKQESIQFMVHQKIIASLAQLDIDFAETREELDRQLAQKIPQRGVRQFLLKNLKRDPEGNFFWGLNIPAIQMNLSRLLNKVEKHQDFPGPVLIISGNKSGYINEKDREDFRQTFSNIKIVEMDAGHWVHAEQPDLLMETLQDFLPGE